MVNKKLKRQKYDYMESQLQDINKKFISIPEEEEKLNKEILQEVVDRILAEMKKKDVLFQNLSAPPEPNGTDRERIFYGGSVYDGLKVSRADEFDLDILLHIPPLMLPTVTTSNVRGFLNVRLCALETGIVTDRSLKEKINTYLNKWGLQALLGKKSYLETSKVFRWMQSVLDRALLTFPYGVNGYKLKTKLGVFHVKKRTDDPAFTLSVQGIVNGELSKFKIDLVPCFAFGQDQWPVHGFKPNPVPSKPGFFVVPKPSDPALTYTPCSDRYWRASFQEQEREIIHDKGFLKPVLKLLKKLTVTQKHNIASYHLKTVLLWQVSVYKKYWRWDQSLSYVFMTILKDYLRVLKRGRIAYFWNLRKKRNFLDKLGSEEVLNITGRIEHIINDVENNIGDASVIVKYLLTPEELAML